MPPPPQQRTLTIDDWNTAKPVAPAQPPTGPTGGLTPDQMWQTAMPAGALTEPSSDPLTRARQNMRLMMDATSGGQLQIPGPKPHRQPRGFGEGPPPVPPVPVFDVSPAVLWGIKQPMGMAAEKYGTPSNVSRASKILLPTVGAIAGGAYGGPGGAGAGAMLGEGASMMVESSVGQPPPVQEVLDRLATAAPTGVANEFGGQLLGAAGKLIKPGKTLAQQALRTMTPEGEEALGYLGGHVTPAQVSDKPSLALLESIASSAPRYRDFMAQQAVKMMVKAQQILEDYGVNLEKLPAQGQLPERAGEAIRSARLGALGSTRETVESGLRSQLAATKAEQAAHVAATEKAAVQQAIREVDPLQTAASDAEHKAFHAQMGNRETADLAAKSRAKIQEGIGARAQGPERTGELFQNLQKTALKAEKDATSALYEDVDEQAKGVKVSLQPLADFLDQELGRVGPIADTLAGGKVQRLQKLVTPAEETAPAGYEGITNPAQLLKALPKSSVPRNPAEAASYAQRLSTALQKSGLSTDEIAQAMGGAGITAKDLEDGTITFTQAHNLRSELGQLVRGYTKSAAPNAARNKGLFQQLKNRLEGSMQTAAQTDPTLYPKYQAANAAYTQLKDKFERSVLAKTARVQPIAVLKQFLGNGSVRDATTARDMISSVDPDAWKQVQAEHWASLTQTPDGRSVTPEKFLSNLSKLRPEFLKAVYGDLQDTIKGLGLHVSSIDVGAERAAMLEKAAGKARSVATQGLSDTQAAIDAQLRAATERGAKVVGGAEKAVSRAEDVTAARVAKLHEQNAITLFKQAADKANAKQLVAMRAMLGDEGFQKVQAASIERYLTNPDGSLRSGADVLSQFGSFQRERGEDVLKTLFPDGGDQRLWQFARVKAQLEKKSGLAQGANNIWISPYRVVRSAGSAAAAAGAIMTLRAPSAGSLATAAAGGAVLLAPRAVARIVTNPEMQKNLITGLKDPGSAIGRRATTQLIGFLVREGFIEKRDADRFGPGSQPARISAPPQVPQVPIR